MNRIVALMSKDLAELRANPGLFTPAIFTGLVALTLPFVVAVGVPYVFGERLSDSSDFDVALEVYRTRPGARGLDPEGAIQAWIFEQFLVMLALSPVAASMSVAAAAVIGEKQARTLEPLLATPLTTVELLTAKVLASLGPALALAAVMFVVYVAGIHLLAGPGVARVLFAPQPLAVMFLIAPLAALASLQLAVCVSSRVNDARSAQQIGALMVLPLSGLLVLQLTGAVVLSLGALLAIAAALVAFNAVLLRVAVTLFDRETILTRWK
jgi:ABC-2 type transport system permease protein